MRSMIATYNQQATALRVLRAKDPHAAVEDLVETVIDRNPTHIKWTRGLINDLSRGKAHQFTRTGDAQRVPAVLQAVRLLPPDHERRPCSK